MGSEASLVGGAFIVYGEKKPNCFDRMRERREVAAVAEQHEAAEKDYISGMKYREIAAKYGVSENTVKSWKTRYQWTRGPKKGVHTKNKKVCTQKSRKSVPEIPELEIADVEEELSAEHKQFCIFFVKSHNATKSYQKVYNCDYASAAVSASRLLKNAKIKTFIDALKNEKLAAAYFSEGDLVQKYMDIMYADITDFAKISEKNGIELREEFDGTLIQDIKMTKYGWSIKLPDKMKAMEWLDRYFEINPQAKRRKEYESLKRDQLQQQIDREKYQEDAEQQEEYGVIEIAPVQPEEEEEAYGDMDTAAEAEGVHGKTGV